nr:ATP-binding cassette domain-containing protein [Ottowia beijingensis]
MNAVTSASDYAIELRDLRKSFGKTEIIRGANLAVRPGERVAIIGPNGAGKSTLFNLISGRLTPSSGEVLLNGQRIDGKKPYEINRMGLARSFQITNVFPKLSVFENLRCALLWTMGYRYTFMRFLSRLHDANARAEELLRMIQLQGKRDVLAVNLPYAEQRALEIGVTIAGGADVILLDEPTAGMSRRNQALHRDDPPGDRRQDAADRGARHGRGVRPGRQDRRGGVWRGDRLRHARGRARQPARAGGVSGFVRGGRAGGGTLR